MGIQLLQVNQNLPTSYVVASHGENIDNLKLSLKNATLGLKQSAGLIGQVVLLTYNKNGQTLVVAAARLKSRTTNIQYGAEIYKHAWHIELLSVVTPFPLESIALEYMTRKNLGFLKQSMRKKIINPAIVEQLNRIFFAKYIC